MRSLVESLKRLYECEPKKVSESKIKSMKVLTSEEKAYILGTEK